MINHTLDLQPRSKATGLHHIGTAAGPLDAAKEDMQQPHSHWRTIGTHQHRCTGAVPTGVDQPCGQTGSTPPRQSPASAGTSSPPHGPHRRPEVVDFDGQLLWGFAVEERTPSHLSFCASMLRPFAKPRCAAEASKQRFASQRYRCLSCVQM
jgi:hypothetical protein